MKKGLKGIALLVASVAFGSFCACEGANIDSNSGSSTQAQTSYSLWSTYNTMKVMQDSAMNGNYNVQGAEISATMAKNELESAQFFVTAGSKDISSFELIASDLKNENGDVFSAENINVYAQKYIEIKEKTVGNDLKEYPVGWYPDAIVPMELYKAYGENFIKSNCNQGFTVDFIATADTPAGTYKGTFELTLDGKTENIPVSVTVWDFALPAQSACQSCALLYEDGILYGEMTSNVDEWYEKYYEQLLRYKVNAFTVPYSYESPEQMVSNVIKYWNHPNFATYGMPHQSWLGANYFQYWHDVLYLMGEESTEEMILFDKGYFYPIDEPNKEDEILVAKDWMARLEKLRNDVADELVANGVFEGKSEEFKNKVLDSLKNMQIVITALGFEEGLSETDVNYCPNINEYDPYMDHLSIEQHAQEHDNQMWYYTANVPTTPYASQHIDDYLITTRIMKWQQKYYGWTGWLNWSANHTYKTTAFTNLVGNINAYEEPTRIFGPGNVANGDGYLLYPASRYEAEMPISTIRLLEYREGQDDLDMLNYLDTLYADYEEYYAVETGAFSVNKVLKGLYDRLFCRAVTYYADEAFGEVRQAVADSVLNALDENGDKFIYTVDYNGKYADYSFYTANGYTVKANGTALTGIASGSGMKYTFRVDLSTASVLSSVTLEKGSVSKVVNLYESETLKSKDVLADDYVVSTSDGSSFVKGENSIVFDIRSKTLATTPQTLRFKPSIVLSTISDFSVLELDVKNLKDSAVTMNLVILSTDGFTSELDVSLLANGEQTLEVLNKLPKNSKVKEIRLEFLNVYSDGDILVEYDTRQIEITGIRFK
ncbi:MAG: DUF4091 domain-containing protein [Clostridia bacterium]|nr:DUF4091 domain-containing protein [Clostridia bacterium]